MARKYMDDYGQKSLPRGMRVRSGQKGATGRKGYRKSFGSFLTLPSSASAVRAKETVLPTEPDETVVPPYVEPGLSPGAFEDPPIVEPYSPGEFDAPEQADIESPYGPDDYDTSPIKGIDLLKGLVSPSALFLKVLKEGIAVRGAQNDTKGELEFMYGKSPTGPKESHIAGNEEQTGVAPLSVQPGFVGPATQDQGNLMDEMSTMYGEEGESPVGFIESELAPGFTGPATPDQSNLADEMATMYGATNVTAPTPAVAPVSPGFLAPVQADTDAVDANLSNEMAAMYGNPSGLSPSPGPVVAPAIDAGPDNSAADADGGIAGLNESDFAGLDTGTADSDGGIAGLNESDFAGLDTMGSTGLSEADLAGLAAMGIDFGAGSAGDFNAGDVEFGVGFEGYGGGVDAGGGADGGTVLCTELHRQGLLPDDIYRADSEHGKLVEPEVLAGYQMWGIPVARWMRLSGTLTRILRPVVTAWAYHMAGRTNWLGSALEVFGVPVCRFLGRNKTVRTIARMSSLRRQALALCQRIFPRFLA